MRAEGWYQDPYRAHRDRWYSDGSPTSLVRDDGVESQDPPPEGVEPADPLVPSAPRADGSPSDLLRADAAESGAQPEPNKNAYGDAAFDTVSEFGPLD